jgi:hypothetical protein
VDAARGIGSDVAGFTSFPMSAETVFTRKGQWTPADAAVSALQYRGDLTSTSDTIIQEVVATARAIILHEATIQDPIGVTTLMDVVTPFESEDPDSTEADDGGSISPAQWNIVQEAVAVATDRQVAWIPPQFWEDDDQISADFKDTVFRGHDEQRRDHVFVVLVGESGQCLIFDQDTGIVLYVDTSLPVCLPRNNAKIAKMITDGIRKWSVLTKRWPCFGKRFVQQRGKKKKCDDFTSEPLSQEAERHSSFCCQHGDPVVVHGNCAANALCHLSVLLFALRDPTTTTMDGLARILPTEMMARAAERFVYRTVEENEIPMGGMRAESKDDPSCVVAQNVLAVTGHADGRLALPIKNAKSKGRGEATIVERMRELVLRMLILRDVPRLALVATFFDLIHGKTAHLGLACLLLSPDLGATFGLDSASETRCQKLSTLLQATSDRVTKLDSMFTSQGKVSVTLTAEGDGGGVHVVAHPLCDVLILARSDKSTGPLSKGDVVYVPLPCGRSRVELARVRAGQKDAAYEHNSTHLHVLTKVQVTKKSGRGGVDVVEVYSDTDPKAAPTTGDVECHHLSVGAEVWAEKCVRQISLADSDALGIVAGMLKDTSDREGTNARSTADISGNVAVYITLSRDRVQLYRVSTIVCASEAQQRAKHRPKRPATDSVYNVRNPAMCGSGTSRDSARHDSSTSPEFTHDSTLGESHSSKRSKGRGKAPASRLGTLGTVHPTLAATPPILRQILHRSSQSSSHPPLAAAGDQTEDERDSVNAPSLAAAFPGFTLLPFVGGAENETLCTREMLDGGYFTVPQQGWDCPTLAMEFLPDHTAAVLVEVGSGVPFEYLGGVSEQVRMRDVEQLLGIAGLDTRVSDPMWIYHGEPLGMGFLTTGPKHNGFVKAIVGAAATHTYATGKRGPDNELVLFGNIPTAGRLSHGELVISDLPSSAGNLSKIETSLMKGTAETAHVQWMALSDTVGGDGQLITVDKGPPGTADIPVDALAALSMMCDAPVLLAFVVIGSDDTLVHGILVCTPKASTPRSTETTAVEVEPTPPLLFSVEVTPNEEADGETDGDADGEVDGDADGEVDGEPKGTMRFFRIESDSLTTVRGTVVIPPNIPPPSQDCPMYTTLQLMMASRRQLVDELNAAKGRDETRVDCFAPSKDRDTLAVIRISVVGEDGGAVDPLSVLAAASRVAYLRQSAYDVHASIHMNHSLLRQDPDDTQDKDSDTDRSKRAASTPPPGDTRRSKRGKHATDGAAGAAAADDNDVELVGEFYDRTPGAAKRMVQNVRGWGLLGPTDDWYADPPETRPHWLQDLIDKCGGYIGKATVIDYLDSKTAAMMKRWLGFLGFELGNCDCRNLQVDNTCAFVSAKVASMQGAARDWFRLRSAASVAAVRPDVWEDGHKLLGATVDTEKNRGYAEIATLLGES